MRIFERSIYLSSSLFLVLRSYSVFSYLLLVLVWALIIYGMGKEGLRIAQLPCILSSLIHILLGEVLNLKFSIYFYWFGILVSIFLVFLYGELDFTSLGEFSGRCGVGTKHFWAKKCGNYVTAYYPIEKTIFNGIRKNTKEKLIPYETWGKNSIIGQKISQAWFQNSISKKKTVDPDSIPVPPFYKNLKIRAVEGHQDSTQIVFEQMDPNKKIKLIPIIFMHGLSSKCSIYSGLLTELASHGYLVLGIDTLDGTNEYTELQDGTKVIFNDKIKFFDLEKRKKQLDQRSLEMSSLIDELFDQDFLQTKLGFSSKFSIDTDKIIVNGHSFGAITSLATAVNDSRVKVTLALDPWFFPVSNLDYQQDKFLLNPNQGCQILTTLSFSDWCKNFVDTFICNEHEEQFIIACQSSGNQNIEQVSLKTSGHLNQCDIPLLLNLELTLVTKQLMEGGTGSTVATKYLLNAWLQIKYLNSLGYGNKLNNLHSVEINIQKSTQHFEYLKAYKNHQL